LHVAGFYKKKNFKKEGGLLVAIRKKIVHDPYVSDGPLPPALPHPY
jgi:hypothetical protein